MDKTEQLLPRVVKDGEKGREGVRRRVGGQRATSPSQLLWAHCSSMENSWFLSRSLAVPQTLPVTPPPWAGSPKLAVRLVFTCISSCIHLPHSFQVLPSTQFSSIQNTFVKHLSSARLPEKELAQ